MDSFKPTVADARGEPPLNDQELTEAVRDVRVSRQNVRINRKFVDPCKPGEPRFALFSYVKAPGVEPDAEGFFGVAKIRGVFFTQDEANEKAVELIKNVDSSNSIYTALVGVPFPLVARGRSLEQKDVDISGDKIEEAMAQNVKDTHASDRKVMEEIKDREAKLKEDVHPEKPLDPFDRYIEQRVKLAHLRHNIEQHKEKLIECETIREKVKELLVVHEREYPDHVDKYMDRYMEARRDANIPDHTDMQGFMNYMTLPIESESEQKSIIVA